MPKRCSRGGWKPIARATAREERAPAVAKLRRGRLSEGTAALVRGECTISGGWSANKGG